MQFRFDNVCLDSVAHVLPETVITSEALEQQLGSIYDRFGLRVGRLELMTGIRERRFWAPGALPSDGSTAAGEAVLESACCSASDLGILLHTSVSRDFLEPATASVVHRRLGLPSTTAFFDISNACLGFLNGLSTCATMIDAGQIGGGLVVAGESSRNLVETTVSSLLADENLSRRELKQAMASLTIGSGAVAAVLSHSQSASRAPRLLGGVVKAATEHHGLCQGSADTGFQHAASMLMTTDSEELLEAGCALARDTWGLFLDAVGWKAAEVDRCFTHQVGVAHRDRLYEVIGRDPTRDFATLEFLGNVGSVSLPLTLSMGTGQQPPRPGEKIALLGIGSGLSCMMMAIEW